MKGSVRKAVEQLQGTALGQSVLIRRYVVGHLERIEFTIGLLPGAQSSPRVLEIGGAPWVFTYVLRWLGYNVVTSQGPSKLLHCEDESSSIELPGGLSCEARCFNAELDTWPFDDQSFDVVLFTEVLEHLLLDPVHALSEAWRVLRPGGLLVLTTPNAISFLRLMRFALLWLAGRSPDGPLPLAVYDKHHREYTAQELKRLLGSTGFSVRQSIVRTFWRTGTGLARVARLVTAGLALLCPNRGEHLVVIAERQDAPAGVDQISDLAWLFSSPNGIGSVSAVTPMSRSHRSFDG